jgi:hypothetical protein
MPIKFILISLFICRSSLALENALAPPKSVDDNYVLLESALTDYKAIFAATTNTGNQINKIITNCNLAINNKVNQCGQNCTGINLDLLKSEVLGCMKKLVELRPSLNTADINILKLNIDLKSGLFNDMLVFKNSLLDKLNITTQTNKNYIAFTESIAGEYSKQYKSLLDSEFAHARSSGKLSGSIIGTCLHLKGAIEGHLITLNMRKFTKSFVFWSQFYDKAKGYELVANALRENCPAEYKPADYSPIVAEVGAFIKTIASEDWVRAECAKPEVKAYMGKRCSGIIVIDPHFISALSQVAK